MRAEPKRRAPPRSAGFTILELVVVVALATLLVVALQRGLIGQRRFYQAQRATAERNETMRFAMAVLGTALREAMLSEGDVEVLDPSRVRVRVPHGFGVVCGADTDGDRLGVVEPRGRWAAGAGDSLLVQRGTGWMAEAISVVEGASATVPCLQAAGLMVGLDSQLPDAVQGSPVRTFRSQVFETGTQDGYLWLYRVDGPDRELLLGPLAATDGFRVWLEDALGAEVAAPAAAARILVRIVATSRDLRGSPAARLDTLTLAFGGRNR